MDKIKIIRKDKATDSHTMESILKIELKGSMREIIDVQKEIRKILGDVE